MRHIFALLLFVAALPTAADPLSEGRAIFDSICADCHGMDGSGGDEAPDIRGISEAEVKRATLGMDAMPRIELTAEERAAISAYLQVLDSEA